MRRLLCFHFISLSEQPFVTHSTVYTAFLRWLILLALSFSLTGCHKNELPAKEKELDFTVVAGTDIPAELQELIDERLKDPFGTDLLRRHMPLYRQGLWLSADRRLQHYSQ